MASGFFRLYRELENQTYDSLPNDLTYEREREQLLHFLGYDVGREHPETVKGPKYHGKNVRKNRDTVVQSKWGTTTDPKAAIEKRRVLNAVIQNGRDLSKVTQKIAASMGNKNAVPDKLVKELVRQDELATRHLARASLANSKLNVSTRNLSTQLPPLQRLPPQTAPVYRQVANSENKRSIVAHPNIVSRESQSKWSKAERDYLSSLYQTIPLPVNQKSLELWRLYVTNVTNRFIGLYPNRTRSEVTAKVQEMISKRQMKEHGEVIYWKNSVSEGRGKA